jgi:16S rRNA processing protein RimM
MAYKAHILLGKITKLYGYEGAVTVKLEKSFIDNIPELESVFLEFEGKPVPFFISETDYQGADILRLKFEGYGSIEKVSDFTGCHVFLTSGKKGKTIGNTSSEIFGCKILLADNTVIGSVKGVIENPEQWLLNVETEAGKEILIPFHKHLIIRIDLKKKIIIMNLPEGLTDLNS